MKRLIFLPLLILINPYSDINPDEIVAYHYDQDSKLEIIETLGDGYQEERKQEAVEVYIPRYLYNYSQQYYNDINFPL